MEDKPSNAPVQKQMPDVEEQEQLRTGKTCWTFVLESKVNEIVNFMKGKDTINLS